MSTLGRRNGKPSFVGRATLGEKTEPDWELPYDIEELILDSLAANHKVVNKVDRIYCGSCRTHESRIHWVELDQDTWLGPYCSSCLKEVEREDLMGSQGLFKPRTYTVWLGQSVFDLIRGRPIAPAPKYQI